MINSYHYNILVHKLREFFQTKKGFIEIPAHARLSILANCTDPEKSTCFTLENSQYPLPQTGQLWLDYELLKNPQWNGVFCLGPSYKSYFIEGKQQQIVPLFEFESHGSFQDLKKLQSELVTFLGFDKPYPVLYEDMCTLYGTQTLEQTHNTMLLHEFGPSLSLENFPEHENLFWNMKQNSNKKFNKTDVLLFGLQTIQSAELATDKQQMKVLFHSIFQGNYAKELYKIFGQERIESELDDYLALPTFKRFSGSINISALEHAFKRAHLFDLHQFQPTRSATMANSGKVCID